MIRPERMEQEWHDKQYQPPRAYDADEQGNVLAWHAYAGMMIVRWETALMNGFITYWRHTPFPPDKIKRAAG